MKHKDSRSLEKATLAASRNQGAERLPKILLSAPARFVDRGEGDLNHEVQEALKEYFPEMPGSHFLSWKVPPSLRRNSYFNKVKGSQAKHIYNQRYFLSTPLHDPNRKRVWGASYIDPECTSLPIPKPQKPIVLSFASAHPDKLKQSLQKLLVAGNKDFSNAAADPLKCRSPSVSDILQPPPSVQTAFNQHNKSFSQKRPIMEQANKKAYHLATHPDRGIPILSAPAGVFHNTRQQKAEFIVHPDWHT